MSVLIRTKPTHFGANYKASLKKEWYETLATYKLLIIFLAFFGLALLDPLMTKLMPILLKDQLNGIDIGALFESSQSAAVALFIGDLLEIAQFVTILTLMGIVSQERLDKRLIIPISLGIDLRAANLAKWTLYIGALLLIIPLSLGTAILYGGLLFEFKSLPGPPFLEICFLIFLYFAGVISLIIAFSDLFKRPLMAGFASFFAVYGLSAIMGLWDGVKVWLPQQLIYYAASSTKEVAYPWQAAVTAVIVIGLALASLLTRKDYVAWNSRF